MINDAGLFIKFWNEITIIDIYLKNKIVFELIIDEKFISPKQIYIKKLSSIDHVRVWNCKCIIYVNPDSHLMNIRRDKLMSKKREAMLMRFDPETTKQYRIYVFDLEKYIKFFTITFFEDIQKNEIDLKLSNFISNELMIRNFKERSKKTLLQFSSIEHKINIIKNISVDSQQLMNSITSSSRSTKSEIIREKKNILSKRDIV